MAFANAIFIKSSEKKSINVNYTNILQEKYNAEVIYDKFESINKINNWVSDKTFN